MHTDWGITLPLRRHAVGKKACQAPAWSNTSGTIRSMGKFWCRAADTAMMRGRSRLRATKSSGSTSLPRPWRAALFPSGARELPARGFIQSARGDARQFRLGLGHTCFCAINPAMRAAYVERCLARSSRKDACSPFSTSIGPRGRRGRPLALPPRNWTGFLKKHSHWQEVETSPRAHRPRRA